MQINRQVLLYLFSDELVELARDVLRKHKIQVRVLSSRNLNDKVGFLVGLRGYNPIDKELADDKVFQHQVLLFHNIKGKELNKTMDTLACIGIKDIKYKAVVTPSNTLWTLGYLFEHMHEEHG